MSVEIIAPCPAISARPIRIPIPEIAPALDRRRRPRRAEDRTQQALAQLARWFIERETQPQIVVDQQMNVLLMNESAKSCLTKSKLLDVSNRKLSFANENHQEAANRVLRNDVAEAILACIIHERRDEAHALVERARWSAFAAF